MHLIINLILISVFNYNIKFKKMKNENLTFLNL